MIKKKNNRVNNDLKYEKIIYLLQEDGISNISFNEAIKIADDANLDLVEISKKDGYPLCKMMDYEKYIYDKKKKDKALKANKQDLKEVRLSPNISNHDMLNKVKMVEKFISNGDKVKVVLILKGRENAKKEFYKKTILDFIVKCDDFASAESLPTNESNKFVVYLKKNKK